jgi:hypothetical protein
VILSGLRGSDQAQGARVPAICWLEMVDCLKGVLKIGDGGDDKRRQIGQKRAKTLEKAKYLAFLRHHRCPRPH